MFVSFATALLPAVSISVFFSPGLLQGKLGCSDLFKRHFYIDMGIQMFYAYLWSLKIVLLRVFKKFNPIILKFSKLLELLFSSSDKNFGFESRSRCILYRVLQFCVWRTLALKFYSVKRSVCIVTYS